jgi:hypothetical protein
MQPLLPILKRAAVILSVMVVIIKIQQVRDVSRVQHEQLVMLEQHL